ASGGVFMEPAIRTNAMTEWNVNVQMMHARTSAECRPARLSVARCRSSDGLTFDLGVRDWRIQWGWHGNRSQCRRSARIRAIARARTVAARVENILSQPPPVASAGA